MANRRQILQGGAAAFAATPMLSPAGSAAGEAGAPVSLYKVIYDDRLAHSRAFGAAAEKRGLPVAGIDGDVTPLWYHDLDPQWRRQPAAVAGLTAHGPLFCLERLAWEKGMRVVFRAVHGSDDDGGLAHDLSGPEIMLRQAATLDIDSSGWPARMAELIAACPAGETAMGETRVPTGLAADFADEPLISWIIAPIGRPAAA